MKNLQSLKDDAKIKRLLYIDQFLLLIKAINWVNVS